MTTIYNETLDPVGELLTLALRSRRTADERDRMRTLLVGLGVDRVRSAARTNQVEPLVANAIAQDLPAELDAEWGALLAANERRVNDLVERLAEVSDHLRRDGCRAMAVEAGGVMLGSNLPFAAYCSGDIDLVVEPGRFDAVDRACRAAGGSQGERGEKTVRGKYRWDSGHARPLWIEVCDVPFDRNWLALPHEDRTAVWLGRAAPSTRAPGVPVPDPTDALVFVAMHTSLHSFIRPPGLRLHVDVDRLASDNAIDWGRAVDEIRALGVPTRAFVSLSMARGLLGSPIPDDVLAALRPSSRTWSRIQRLLASDGVIADGRPKLSRARTVILDALIDERPLPVWLYRVVVPPAAWMQGHFGAPDAPLWRRHAGRVRALTTRWRPR